MQQGSQTKKERKLQNLIKEGKLDVQETLAQEKPTPLSHFQK